MEQRARQTAYKMRIGDMINGNIIFDGDRFSSLEAKNKKVSRINVICNVVDKYSNPEKNFNSVTIDDGTGQIRVKAFSESTILLNGLEIGDTVKIIGLLRQFNDELYIMPEIVTRVDVKWAYVRRLELVKEYGEFEEKINAAEKTGEKYTEPEEEIIEREKLSLDTEETSRAVILKKIRENKDGIDIEQLIMELKFPVNEINSSISSLISEGEVYEPKPGHLRSLD